jgi:hypothetical protein
MASPGLEGRLDSSRRNLLNEEINERTALLVKGIRDVITSNAGNDPFVYVERGEQLVRETQAAFPTCPGSPISTGPNPNTPNGIGNCCHVRWKLLSLIFVGIFILVVLLVIILVIVVK